jgi:hypothetical protein
MKYLTHKAGVVQKVFVPREHNLGDAGFNHFKITMDLLCANMFSDNEYYWWDFSQEEGFQIPIAVIQMVYNRLFEQTIVAKDLGMTNVMRIDNREITVSTYIKPSCGEYTVHKNKIWKITSRDANSMKLERELAKEEVWLKKPEMSELRQLIKPTGYIAI